MSITQQIAQAYLNNWIKHFWDKVEKTESCWIWKGTVNRHGYGRVAVLHHTGAFVAHRVAYEICTGEILTPEQVLMHTCDNPSCVNPDHLQPGTQADNMADMRSKGRAKDNLRGRKGAENVGAKYSPETIKNVRHDRNQGYSYSQLISKYGISKSQISRICRRTSWSHLTDQESEF